MIIKIKGWIQKIFRKFGFDITRIEPILNLDLYKKLYNEESLEKRRFYNIGAGSFKHPYWTNVDKLSEYYSKIQDENDCVDIDLFSLEKFPIKDGVAEVVYSSHVVEHITDEAAQHMMNESFRFLKDNGVFRITMPDIDLDYIALQNNDFNHYYWIDDYSQPYFQERAKMPIPMNQASIQQIFLYQFVSQNSELYYNKEVEKISDAELMNLFKTKSFDDALNYCTAKCDINLQQKDPGNHMNWWNENKTIKMLKNAGFKKIYRSGYGQSICPVLRNVNFFDNTHPKNSLYIEAIK
jgi:predicted SAM-dependent methyltransferase